MESKVFLHSIQTGLIIKENINKPDFFKNFYSLNDIIKITQKQTREKERTFAMHVSNKELLSRIYNQLKKVSKEKDNPLLKMGQKKKKKLKWNHP